MRENYFKDSLGNRRLKGRCAEVASGQHSEPFPENTC